MLAQILPSIEKLVIAATRILVILIASYAVYKLAAVFLGNFIRLWTKRKKDTGARTITLRKRAFTLAALLQNVLKYFIFFVAASLILDALGQNVLPLIAGAGIVGVALGFGAQSLVKDILAGFSVLFEDQYAVGDFVVLTGPPTAVSGIVEEFGLRMTKIKDVEGTIHYLPNGTIVGVERFAQGFATYKIDFLLPVEVKKEEIAQVLNQAGEELAKKQSLVISPPKVVDVFRVQHLNIIRTQTQIVPSQDWVAEKLVAPSLNSALKRSLNIENLPAPLVYQVDEDMITKYRQSLSLE